MRNIANIISGALLTFATYFLGGWDKAIQTLVIIMVLDYITGVCKAIKQKNLNSRTGLVGFLKKFGYIIIVALAVLIDGLAGDTGVIRTVTIYFFIANDGLSVVENWGAMGLPLPKKLVEALEQLKQENE